MESSKPTTYLDAWRFGARFAIRKLADKTSNYLTEGFREMVLMNVAQEVIKYREHIRKINDGTDSSQLTESFLREGFKEGARFVVDEVSKYDIAFLTDHTMADTIRYATEGINKECAKILP